MTSSEILAKAEALHALGNKVRTQPGVAGPFYDEFALAYGEIEDIIKAVLPQQTIQFKGQFSESLVYSNYIEAGFLANVGWYQEQGWLQLNQFLGRVRRLASDPSAFRPEASITAVVESLRRFRECCQYMREAPESEYAIQDILWIMLRSHFDRLERESTLPRFGNRTYRPDFAIPDLHLLIEAKFVGEKTSPGDIQESILADVPAYLAESTSYQSVIVFVYDHAQKLRDSRKFQEDVKSVNGIVDVIVTAGVGTAAQSANIVGRGV